MPMRTIQDTGRKTCLNEAAGSPNMGWNPFPNQRFLHSFCSASWDHKGVVEFTRECCHAFGCPLKPTGCDMMSLGKLCGFDASKQPWRHNSVMASGNT